MTVNTRRDFLADVGRGMLVAGIGSSLAGELGLCRFRLTDEPENAASVASATTTPTNHASPPSISTSFAMSPRAPMSAPGAGTPTVTPASATDATRPLRIKKPPSESLAPAGDERRLGRDSRISLPPEAKGTMDDSHPPSPGEVNGARSVSVACLFGSPR